METDITDRKENRVQGRGRVRGRQEARKEGKRDAWGGGRLCKAGQELRKVEGSAESLGRRTVALTEEGKDQEEMSPDSTCAEEPALRWTKLSL